MKAAPLNTFYRSDIFATKVGSSWQNCHLQPEFPVFSCKCVWEGRSSHGKHTSHIIMIIAFIDVYGANGCCFMFVDAVFGKTTLLEANFGIFKYQQVFINV